MPALLKTPALGFRCLYTQETQKAGKECPVFSLRQVYVHVRAVNMVCSTLACTAYIESAVYATGCLA